jgi:hypothetical protein
MRLAMHPGRCLGAVIALVVLSLLPTAGSAGSPSTPDEAVRLRSEWEQVRENQERAIRDNAKQIAAILAKEGGASTDEQQRAEKITQERIAGINADLEGGGKGKPLAQTAEKAGNEAAALAELYKAQDEYLGIVTREWAEDRKKLQEANTALEKNWGLINSHLARATEAALAASRRVQESGVLEKAAQSEAAAREIRELLTARAERERAALEREREQRERETAERARRQRW